MKRSFVLTIVLALFLAACAQPTPIVVEKEVVVEKPVVQTVVVEKEVIVEKPVVQTVVVEKEVSVKETVVVEKEVPVGVKRGGILVDVRAGDPPSLDPHVASSLTAQRAAGLFYNGLVTLDSDGNIVPDLAESWELTDPTTVVFHLREGVTFHDGSDFTAEDAKYSYERVLDEETGSWMRSKIASVESVEMVDDYTVTMHMKEPFAGFLGSAFYIWILPSEMADKPADFLLSNEIGTGPYMLDAWEPGIEMRAKKNPNYWKAGRPYLDGIVIKVIPDETSAIAALRTGEVDHVHLTDPKNYDVLKGNPNLSIHLSPALGPNIIDVNHRPHSPLSDARVMEALACAMDREEILQAAGAGLGAVSGPIPPSMAFWYIPVEELPCYGEVTGNYEQDLERAKQLLADAGYPDGFKLRVFSFAVSRPTVKMGELLQAQWARIGVEVDLSNLEVGVLVDTVKNQPDGWDIYTNLNPTAADPDGLIHYLFHSSGVHPQQGAWGERPESEELDAILEESRSALDPEKRKELYRQASILGSKLNPVFITYNSTWVDVVQKWVKGFEGNPTPILLKYEEVWLDK